MAEFKPIETQEQLNEIIGERVARAKETAAQEHAEEIEGLKKTNKDYETQIAQLTEQIKANTGSAEETDKKVKELEAQVQSYATAAVKTKIAHETGLPYELAEKLSGETEEDIKADAEKMMKLFKVQPAAPMGSPEADDPNMDSTKKAFMQMSKSLSQK